MLNKALIFSVLLLIQPLAQSGNLILENATYFDNASLSWKQAKNIEIKHGQINKISNEEVHCSDCEVINIKGKFLIPGLMDLHQHTGLGDTQKYTHDEKIEILSRNLFWGITTVLNPNIKLDLNRDIKTAITKKPHQYPDFYSAGLNIGPKGGWGNHSIVTVEDAKQAVELMANANVDGIKFSQDTMNWLSSTDMPVLANEVVEILLSSAQQKSLPVYVHLSSLNTAKKVIKNGADTLIHSIIDGPVDQEFIDIMKAENGAYIATLLVYDTIFDSQASVKRQSVYDPKRIHGEQIYNNMGSESMKKNWYQWWDKANKLDQIIPMAHQNVKRLVDAGVKVGIGTDADTPAMILGPSLAYEMELHVKAGLSKAKVLDLATRGNASVLNIDNEVGSIEEGKRADMVILSENVLENFEALNSIERVFRNGIEVKLP